MIPFPFLFSLAIAASLINIEYPIKILSLLYIFILPYNLSTIFIFYVQGYSFFNCDMNWNLGYFLKFLMMKEKELYEYFGVYCWTVIHYKMILIGTDNCTLLLDYGTCDFILFLLKNLNVICDSRVYKLNLLGDILLFIHFLRYHWTQGNVILRSNCDLWNRRRSHSSSPRRRRNRSPSYRRRKSRSPTPRKHNKRQGSSSRSLSPLSKCSGPSSTSSERKNAIEKLKKEEEEKKR